jgi:predicted ester cyclase
MSVKQNKTSMYRCFEEIWNKGDLSVIPEVISPDYVDNGGRKGVKDFEQYVKASRASMPDQHWTIDQVVGEGDTLAIRLTVTGTFTGKMGDVKPTGKKGSYTFVLFNRYVDGKCVEATSFGDTLAYYRQWGIPLPKE